METERAVGHWLSIYYASRISRGRCTQINNKTNQTLRLYLQTFHWSEMRHFNKHSSNDSNVQPDMSTTEFGDSKNTALCDRERQLSYTFTYI